jgi:hypothetical protein
MSYRAFETEYLFSLDKIDENHRKYTMTKKILTTEVTSATNETDLGLVASES